MATAHQISAPVPNRNPPPSAPAPPAAPHPSHIGYSRPPSAPRAAAPTSARTADRDRSQRRAPAGLDARHPRRTRSDRPKIDCVFKALLGAEENRNLLIHFLNAILGPDLQDPVTQVLILNPYNHRKFLSDKLNIVDIKAHDDRARRFQIDIQLLTYAALLGRVLYTLGRDGLPRGAWAE
jgi:hypothetical protein